jgi:hypothetical protein
MQRGGVEIILERRTGRKVLGCAAIGIVVGFLVCLAIEPGEALPLFVFFGILLGLVLLSMRFDFSKKRNIILSTHGIRFSEGRNIYKPMEIPWNALGEVKHLKKVSKSEHGESFYYILELMRTGSSREHAKPFIIHYCNNLGRQVPNSTANFTAKRAVELIEKLRDANSEEERIQILKDNNRGKLPEEVKARVRNIPWKQRLVRYCPVCELIVVVDGRKEKTEQRCHSCGSNETYKDQSEYLQTLDKKA